MDFGCKDPLEMTPEERVDALAEALAEGFFYLAEHGLLAEVMGESGCEKSTEKRPESPCFPSEHRLSFLPEKEGAPIE
ncbi:MAG TPA: hypothetical protein DCM05_10390 [Elusimicrobia bacterium]|nr:hypothetical protein [Elusimicrobiota bacterium]